MGSTVIFTHGGGRFGNQLIQFGHLIAMAEEHPALNLVNYSFWPYAGFCAGTIDNPFCQYSPSGQKPPALGALFARSHERLLSIAPAPVAASLRFRLPRLPHKYLPSRSVDLHDTWGGVDVTALGGLRSANPVRLDWRAGEDLDLGNPELLARLGRGGSVFLAGSPLRDVNAFHRHADTVRAFLGLAPRFQEPAVLSVAAHRRRHKTLIGVLVRQQDYRIWSGGRYFFPSSQYREWMMQALDVFGPDCGLLVATDEEQPPHWLDGLAAAWCTGAAGTGGHFVSSMAELSLCDIIISPPSTFSGWPAFLGGIPFLALGRPEQAIKREDLVTRGLFDIIDPKPFSEWEPSQAPSTGP